MGVDVDHMDDEVTIQDLESEGIEVVNVSGSFEIEGEFDLPTLAEDLPNAEHDAENNQSLIYRGESAMILLPRGGRVSIVRATTPEGIREGIEEFVSELAKLGLNRDYSNIQVENTVATANLETHLDLNAVTITLGLECAEYEPEQFPGVIYRPEDGAVIMIFSSGKIVITAAVTYKDAMDAFNTVRGDLSALIE